MAGRPRTRARRKAQYRRVGFWGILFGAFSTNPYKPKKRRW